MPNYIDELFWEKYRPKSLNQMILLPRIKTELHNGFKRNYLLYGHQGTGKTTITRILLKDKDFIRINASLNGKIDTLRDELEDFCSTMKSPFIKSDDKMKYIYMEEFENSTKDFQDGIKAFIEDYSERVRFIITMNELSEIKVPALLSRFQPIVCFDPINDEERQFLHAGYLKYLSAVAKNAGLSLQEKTLLTLINTFFPDLRSAVQGVQQIYLTGNEEIQIQETYTDVYEFIMDKSTNFDKIYDYVIDNYTNRPKDLMVILGRPFYKYLRNNFSNIITNKGLNLINVTKNFNSTYNSSVDPVLHLISYITELQKILNS
jgi:DNA polymerase III delta prime subunit